MCVCARARAHAAPTRSWTPTSATHRETRSDNMYTANIQYYNTYVGRGRDPGRTLAARLGWLAGCLFARLPASLCLSVKPVSPFLLLLSLLFLSSFLFSSLYPFPSSPLPPFPLPPSPAFFFLFFISFFLPTSGEKERGRGPKIDAQNIARYFRTLPPFTNSRREWPRAFFRIQKREYERLPGDTLSFRTRIPFDSSRHASRGILLSGFVWLVQTTCDCGTYEQLQFTS